MSFGTCQFCKISVLVNFIIQKLKFCKIKKFISVSLVRGKSERIEKKFKGKSSNPNQHKVNKEKNAQTLSVDY